MRAGGHGLFPFRIGHHLVHQPPFDRLAAADALLDRAEHVGAVTPHLAFVGDAGEPASTRQHRQQRRLRQRHRRAAVVHQHDVVGGKRQLVAAAGSIAVDGTKIDLLGILRRVLDGQTRLVGELAEVYLLAVCRLAEHADIGAGAEHIVLARLNDDATHLRMLEAQPLHGVVELDIDGKIVGVELELVLIGEPAGRIDIHDQIGNVAVALDAPMAVARGIGLEIDGLHVLTGAGVKPSGDLLPLCIILHINSTSAASRQQRRWRWNCGFHSRPAPMQSTLNKPEFSLNCQGPKPWH